MLAAAALAGVCVLDPLFAGASDDKQLQKSLAVNVYGLSDPNLPVIVKTNDGEQYVLKAGPQLPANWVNGKSQTTVRRARFEPGGVRCESPGLSSSERFTGSVRAPAIRSRSAAGRGDDAVVDRTGGQGAGDRIVDPLPQWAMFCPKRFTNCTKAGAVRCATVRPYRTERERDEDERWLNCGTSSNSRMANSRR